MQRLQRMDQRMQGNGGRTMSERMTDQREKEWQDTVPDDDEYTEPYEETYRDGSIRHECWDSDR